jgi:hypothetical protein
MIHGSKGVEQQGHVFYVARAVGVVVAEAWR